MTKFFDKLEDLIREYLSRHPITYSIIGGIGVVLFWRAVWETNVGQLDHLIMTGRDCPKAFINKADLVTEMKEIKGIYPRASPGPKFRGRAAGYSPFIISQQMA